MTIIYLAAVPVIVKSEKHDNKEWGVFCEAVSDYAEPVNGFMHTNSSGAGVGKLQGLARLIAQLNCKPTEKFLVICGDDGILWDSTLISNGASPEFYSRPVWNRVLSELEKKNIPFKSLRFHKAGLLSNEYEDRAKNIAEERGLEVRNAKSRK